MENKWLTIALAISLVVAFINLLLLLYVIGKRLDAIEDGISNIISVIKCIVRPDSGETTTYEDPEMVNTDDLDVEEGMTHFSMPGGNGRLVDEDSEY